MLRTGLGLDEDVLDVVFPNVHGETVGHFCAIGIFAFVLWEALRSLVTVHLRRLLLESIDLPRCSVKYALGY